MGGLFAVVGVLAAIGGVAIAVYGIKVLGEIKQTSAWPSCAGVVVASGTTVHVHSDMERPHDETRMYEPSIRYEYEVAGRKYTADRITYGKVARTGGWAATMLARYPVGEEVTVYYDPRDPKSAVLRPGDTAGIGILFSAAAMFIVVGSIFAWLGSSF